MKKKFKFLLGTFVFVFLFSACQNLFGPKKEVKKEEKEISGPLLAQVNDWRIGLGDFEKGLKALEPFAKEQKLDINDYEFKRKFLNELVKRALLAEEAKAKGLDKEKDFIDDLETYKQTLLAQKIIQEEMKFVDVTDAEIENFYNQNKEDYFKKPEEVKVREIVVDNESTAKDLYIRLLQGESFATLAREYSVAKSKDEGGDLGYISYDPKKKFRKFWEVVLSLDKGDLSSMFKGEDGKYYILKLEDKRGGKITPLSELREEIRKVLRIDKENKKIEELVNSAKQKAKVIINEDLLR